MTPYYYYLHADKWMECVKIEETFSPIRLSVYHWLKFSRLVRGSVIRPPDNKQNIWSWLNRVWKAAPTTTFVSLALGADRRLFCLHLFFQPSSSSSSSSCSHLLKWNKCTRIQRRVFWYALFLLYTGWGEKENQSRSAKRRTHDQKRLTPSVVKTPVGNAGARRNKPKNKIK